MSAPQTARTCSSATGRPTRSRPAAPGRDPHGGRSCWSTDSANTPDATSTSAPSCRRPVWSQYHDDVAERLAAVRASAGGRPVILYAHSLGSLIAAGYLLGDHAKPDLAVLSSPALDSTLSGWKKRFAPVLARVVPTAAIPNGIDGETLSRDPSVAARTVDDPSCVKVSTARFGALGLAEQARVRSLAARGFGLPTLVLHGEDDRLVPTVTSAVFAGAPGVERRTYPNLRHELHNEPEGPTIVDEIITWIGRQTAGARER